MLVLDCSVVAAWFLKEETLSAQLRETMCAVTSGRIACTSSALLPFEFANVLASAIKRGRYHMQHAAAVAAVFEEFPLDIAEHEMTPVGEMFELATRLGLSAYDASYLLVAKKKGAALVTLDTALARAARETGVQVAPRS